VLVFFFGKNRVLDESSLFQILPSEIDNPSSQQLDNFSDEELWAVED
jgi:hypothetical protein